jgi:hypothetical protein
MCGIVVALMPAPRKRLSPALAPEGRQPVHFLPVMATSRVNSLPDR